MTEAAKSKERIERFIDRWTGRGYEKGDSQVFWLELLHDVLSIDRPTEVISFESRVKLSNTSFIDAYIPSTKVLIEQKSIDKDLRNPIRQSDGTMLSPLEQAKRYAHELPYSMYPRWVVACNFRSFLIYDMENPQGEPFEVLLGNLERDAHLLGFLVTSEGDKLQHEMEVSIEAGALVGKLYDALLLEYGDEANEADLHALNVLCVRLVFCLYAEDAGIFGKGQFVNYLQSFAADQIRIALKELFAVLDTPIAERDRFLDSKLKAFPYVNGSLFRIQPGETIPPFTRQTADLLIQEASLGFDWSQISPTIFGAVFESTLNPETRRSGGMHYTSIENIHKVIDPLFMDELTEEYNGIAAQPDGKTRQKRLEDFQAKLAGLRFLDPACGSGNFLTETYVSLRRLENRAIAQRTHGQVLLGVEEVNPIKVNIHQFHGIEINDFAVTVAKTALWIAEAQMMAETEKIIRFNDDYLPLKSYNNIVEGNALRIDWNEVCPAGELNYIIGNPPFVGYSLQSKEQKDDLHLVMPHYGSNIDYVAGWYYKAAKMMNGTSVRAALVSTNSITQGEQVAALWKNLFGEFGIHIDFAYRTFRWDSESAQKAHVHCVIVGFSEAGNTRERMLFDEAGNGNPVANINAYLCAAPDVFIDKRRAPICNVNRMNKGSQPTDGGNFFLTQEEKGELLKSSPELEPYVRKFLGADEFLNNKERYCLWLVGANPSLLRKSPFVMDRIDKVRQMRLQSTKEATRKWADNPTLFTENRQPKSSYLLFPRHSSEKRRYLPIGYLPDEVVCGDANLMIPDASAFDFGVLTSNVHMAWLGTVCGRLEMRYRYSNDIVYNNFPWPTPTDAQKAKIEQTAQAILDARALYPDSSLADLYDDLTMPSELRRAHQANDRAVMEAYAFAPAMSESDIVSHLLEMYQQLTKC